MRFLDLYISGFGKFHDTAVSFEDGLNVIYGKNEAGKSTIHTFIRGMLFGIERQRGRAARNDIYSKYEPWENSGTYEGQLRLESDDGTIYRIERSFQKNKKEFTVINETTGREEPDGRAVLQEILGGMSETMYNNTISISQLKSATDEGMVSELKNYIANMNTSGNMALNITKATAYLKNQRKQFESQLSPEASVNYTSLLSEIRALERELSSPKYENQLQEYSKLRDSVRNELEHQKIEKEDLSDRLQKSRQVLDEFSFTDEASIEAYRSQAETLYQNYQHAQVSSSSKGSRVFPGVFLCHSGDLRHLRGILRISGVLPASVPVAGSWSHRPHLWRRRSCASHAGNLRHTAPEPPQAGDGEKCLCFIGDFAPPSGRIRDFG